MSGSGSKRPVCSCPTSHCFGGKCKCFKAQEFCDKTRCMCNDCDNTQSNKAKVDMRYEEYRKRQIPDAANYLTRPPGGFPVPEDFRGCKCKQTKCAKKCACLLSFYLCTSKCQCKDCGNREGIGGSGPSNVPGQGGAGGVSDVRDEAELPTCSCLNSRCLKGNCSCFKAKEACSPGRCVCKNCNNTESNKADVEARHDAYLKRQTPVDKPTVPPGGFPVPADFPGCNCTKTRCVRGRCACLENGYRCTSKCECVDCANPSGVGWSGSSNAPGQGGTGGASNMPDDTSGSMAKEPANKRLRQE